MSSVWSASMSNGVSDLACHMCLSAYKLTGWAGGCVRAIQEECNWINSSVQWQRVERVKFLLQVSGLQFTLTPNTSVGPFINVTHQTATWSTTSSLSWRFYTEPLKNRCTNSLLHDINVQNEKVYIYTIGAICHPAASLSCLCPNAVSTLLLLLFWYKNTFQI